MKLETRLYDVEARRADSFAADLFHAAGRLGARALAFANRGDELGARANATRAASAARLAVELVGADS